ncbi:MAG: hypothetical protein ACPGVT_08350 [Maricaulaceae bacterium]
MAALSACGGGGNSTSAPTPIGGGGGTTPPPAGTTFNLPVTLDGQAAGGALSFNEGTTVALVLDASDTTATSATLAQSTGTQINFGAFQTGGFSAGNNLSITSSSDAFVVTLTDVEGERTATFPDAALTIQMPLPAVSADTPVTLALSYTDGSQTTNETISFTIVNSNTSGKATVSGTVTNGSAAKIGANTRVILTDATAPKAGRIADANVLGEGFTDENGTYTITMDTVGAGEILGVTAILGGTEFFDAGDGKGFREHDKILGAVIKRPEASTFNTENLNVLTDFTASHMVGLATQANSFGLNGNTVLRAADKPIAEGWVAGLFGLAEGDFSDLSFDDVKDAVTSINQDDVKAALTSAGLL